MVAGIDEGPDIVESAGVVAAVAEEVGGQRTFFVPVFALCHSQDPDSIYQCMKYALSQSEWVDQDG